MHPITVACKRKMLLVKYIYKRIKNGCKKKESYHPICMRNELNRTTDVRGNETMNKLVLILCSES
jgi:hypothetical protein